MIIAVLVAAGLLCVVLPATVVLEDERRGHIDIYTSPLYPLVTQSLSINVESNNNGYNDGGTAYTKIWASSNMDSE